VWRNCRAFGPRRFSIRRQDSGCGHVLVPGIKDSGWTRPRAFTRASSGSRRAAHSVDKRALAAQLSQLVVFDFLTSKPDRYSGGNIRRRPTAHACSHGQHHVLLHRPEATSTPRSILHRTQRFSRQLYQALDRVTVPALERILAQRARRVPDLTPSEIRPCGSGATCQRHITGWWQLRPAQRAGFSRSELAPRSIMRNMAAAAVAHGLGTVTRHRRFVTRVS